MKRSLTTVIILLIIVKILILSTTIFNYLSCPFPKDKTAIASDRQIQKKIQVKNTQKAEDVEIDKLRDIQKMIDIKKAELLLIEKEIDRKLQELKRLRDEIRAEWERRDRIDANNLKHLVKIYSSMKPQKAATLLEKVDLDLSVELLSHMRGETVGRILSFMDEQRAAKICELLRKAKR